MAGGEVLAELILQGDREFRKGMERSEESMQDFSDTAGSAKGPANDAARSIDKVGDEADESSSQVSSLSKKLGAAKGKMKGMGQAAMGAGKTLSMGVTMPILAAGGASLKAASDVEEMQAKMQTVFKDSTQDIKDWASVQAEATNRSKFQFQQWATSLQDTFVPMGFAREESAEMSKELSVLANDLASFNNMKTDRALNNLQSGLIGNHEALREFGVMINQSTLEQELMNQGMAESIKEASEQEKMMARLAIIQRSTADAQGDAARTADSFANQMRGLKAALKEAGVAIGRELMPQAKALLGQITPLIRRFSGLDDRSKRLILVVGGLAAAIGPLLMVLGALAIVIGTLSAPILAAVAAIAAIIAIAITFKDTLQPLWTALSQLATFFMKRWPAAMATGRSALDKFRAFIQPTIDTLKPLMVLLIKDFVKTLKVWAGWIMKIVGMVERAWAKHGDRVMAVLTPLANFVRLIFEQMADYVITSIRVLLAILRGDFDEAGDIIMNFFGRMKDRARRAGEALIEAFTEGIKNMAGAAKKAAEEVVDGVRDYLPGSDAKVGPLSDLTDSGEALPGTLAAGIQGGQGTLAKAADEMASEVSMKQRLAAGGAGGASDVASGVGTPGASRMGSSEQVTVDARMEEGAIQFNGITWEEALSRVKTIIDDRLSSIERSIKRKYFKGRRS